MPNTPFKRILVTGGTGFIGRYVTSRLVAEGHRPVVTQLELPTEATDLGSDVELVGLDLRDKEHVSRLLRDLRPDVVLHLAGVTGHSDADGRICDEVNNRATAHLLDCLTHDTVTKIVILGSAAEYGPQPTPFREAMSDDPRSPYATSRSQATRYAMSLASNVRLPVTVIRLFSVFGIGQPKKMFLPQLIEHAISGREFLMTIGTQLRDFIHVEDCVSAILLAASSSEANGKIINVAGGVGHKLSDVARVVWRYSGSDPDLLRIGSIDAHNDDAFDTHADIRLAMDVLGWSPKREFISNNESAEALVEMIESVREAM
ncbi:MAG: NAD(P)-dependent oxidoreductase [Pyrinomonadaceae bacterium]|nr:NAD(P)-dependent oxidoreductase [Pyrinomonadaceae bacterium]